MKSNVFWKCDCRIKTYAALNHLFVSGTGTPTNTEYLIEGHVDEEVISDIAFWITNR